MKQYNPHKHGAYDVRVDDCEICGWGQLYQRCRGKNCKNFACDGYCMLDGPRCCQCWKPEDNRKDIT